MKTIEDLWPKDLVEIDTPSPKEILIEQANYLSERTKNILIGEVRTGFISVADIKGGSMVHEFIIKAPSMGNYQFVLLRVIHNLSIYPLTMSDELSEQKFEVHDDYEFKRTLSEILSSRLVKNAISSLVGRSLDTSYI